LLDQVPQPVVPTEETPGPQPELRAAEPRRPLVKSFLHWFTRWQNIAVCLTAVVVLGLHLSLLTNPPQLMFDEQHYVPEAKSFLHAEGIKRPEHAPLAKWIIAGGIRVFGDNPTGWRAPSVLFGLAAIFIFYFICVRLTARDPEAAGGAALLPAERGTGRVTLPVFVPVVATFMFATENLNFVQGHVAMLDVFYATLMLLGFLLFLRGNYSLSGVALGLSLLAKPMAALGIVGLLVYWAVSRRKEIWDEVRFTTGSIRRREVVRPQQSHILGIIKFGLAVVIVWLALLPLLEYPAAHQWANPIDRTWYIIHTHAGLTVKSTTTAIATRPWIWPVYPGGLFYWYTPIYLGSIGWTLWALIVVSMAYLAYQLVRRRRFNSGLPLFTFCWFFGTYLLLIPMELISDRLMYVFYFYPTVGAIALGIAWGAWSLWNVMREGKRTRTIFLALFGVYLAGTVATLIVMGPYGSGLGLIKIPTS